MRIVGTQNRTEIELDPASALRLRLLARFREVRVLNIDGLLKTKTDYREKDVLDKQVLLRIKQSLRHD